MASSNFLIGLALFELDYSQVQKRPSRFRSTMNFHLENTLQRNADMLL